MDSDEARRIIAWGASGRSSRGKVIARPTTLGVTFRSHITLSPHLDTCHTLGLVDRPPWTVADRRRTR